MNQNLCGNINVFGYFKICNTRRGGVEIISQFAIAGSGTLPEFCDHAGGIQEAMQFLAQDIEFWRYQWDSIKEYLFFSETLRFFV